jgi:replicative DNA helicase
VLSGYSSVTGLNEAFDVTQQLDEPLKPFHFSDPRNAMLWDVFCKLSGMGEALIPPNIISALEVVCDCPLGELNHYADKEVFSHRDALYSAIEEFNPTEEVIKRLEENITHVPALYAKGVVKAWLLRQELLAIGNLQKISSDAFSSLEERSNAQDVYLDIQARLAALQGQIKRDASLKDAATSAQEFLEYLEQKESGEIDEYLKTGWLDFDRYYDGLPHGMSVLFGRSGMGKTAAALNLALNVAKQGHDVLIFSLEMTTNQLMLRLLSSLSGIDAIRIRRNELSDQERARLVEATCDFAEKYRIYIYEGQTRLDVIQEQIKKYAIANNRAPKLVIVDYLQKVTVKGKTNSRYEEVTYVSQVLSDLATFFKIRPEDRDCQPFRLLAVAQASRATETRQEKNPQMSDLKESGQIEQDSQMIIGLFRPSYYNPDAGNTTEFHLLKNRHGEGGKINLYWDGATTTFRNLGVE